MNDEAQHYNRQGLQLLHADRLEEAVEFFSKAIELDPEYSEAYLNRGEVCLLLDRVVEGNTDIQKAKDLKSGKLRSSKSVAGPVQKMNMEKVDSIYDALYPEGSNNGDNALQFDDDLYDYVFSDDSLDDDTVWDNLIHDETDTRGFPSIIEYHDGDREEVPGVLLFQPTRNEITLTLDDGNTKRVVSLAQISCIRMAGIPQDIVKVQDASCQIEIIESVGGNIYHESIHPEQDINNLLLGFSTKEDTRFRYTLIPKENIQKRCQQRYLGDILIEKRYIAGDIFKRALEEYQQMKSMKLGKIIAQRANLLYASVEREIQNAYANNIRGLKTGEILLAAGLVNEEQILDALEYQETIQNQKIGQFLIEKGIIQEKEIYVALAEKFRIPFIDLRKQKVTQKTLTALPRDMVIQHHIMPLSFQDETLIVATLQPDTSSLRDFVMKHTQYQEIRFALVQPSHLKNVINLLYKKNAKS